MTNTMNPDQTNPKELIRMQGSTLNLKPTSPVGKCTSPDLKGVNFKLLTNSTLYASYQIIIGFFSIIYLELFSN